MRDEEEAQAPKRGFAGMDREKLREISRKGGEAAKEADGVHRYGAGEEAQAAGRKGGRAVSRDREHMAAIGRLGGRASGKKRRGGGGGKGESKKRSKAA